jgi:ADP-ribose pyrophosphatase YjhB (NUDIX family)
MQVYAVVYDTKGNFLIGKKLAKGYFFSTNGGCIVKAGQTLNGAGKYALPGGKLNYKEAYTDGALREFVEETGFSTLKVTTQQGVPWAETKTGKLLFAAGYFDCTGIDWTETVKAVTTNLGQAKKAADAIQAGTLTEYKKIFTTYPGCPQDNELELVEVWNVKNSTDWDKIKLFTKDPDLDWYYQILDYLKGTLLI